MTIFQDKSKPCSDMRLFTENDKAGKYEWPKQEDTVGMIVANWVSSPSVPQINCNALVMMKCETLLQIAKLWENMLLMKSCH